MTIRETNETITKKLITIILTSRYLNSNFWYKFFPFTTGTKYKGKLEKN